MPVLNEAAGIVVQLQSLQADRQLGHELIVVDGGSTDDSVALAEPLADAVIKAEPGRSAQMNRGAALASGEILLFLHVDTALPESACELIEGNSATSELRWGWFPVRLSNPGPAYRLIAACMNLRARVTRVSTGDQALFVSRELFRKVGGYPAIPLMEDVAITKALRRCARPLIIDKQVTSSSRRWEQKGIVRTILLMWKLRLLYFLGVSPLKLVSQYYQAGNR